MDFSEQIDRIGDRLENKSNLMTTEESTKHSLVLPMLQALDYDVFNPSEVSPEYVADVGTKKGEKVDYAIKKDGKVIMLIECKTSTTKLDDKHLSQLYRYFGVSEAKFGVLTNGIIYKFYTDLSEENKMDKRPFFQFDLSSYKPKDIKELRKFAKQSFELSSILENAQTLKWRNAISIEIQQEFENPSDDLVRLFAKKVFDGKVTQNIADSFRGIISKSFYDIINNKIDETLQSAIHRQSESEESEVIQEEQLSDIVTTDEEIQAHLIVSAICAETIPPERVVMRDAKSYCAILLDDNNRKPICRLHFNTKQMHVGTFKGKEETKHPINTLSEIYGLSSQIKQILSEYED